MHLLKAVPSVVASDSLNILMSYPAMTSWPKLPKPAAVHLKLNAGNTLTLPAKVMREAGIDPTAGVHVAVFEGRALVWTDGKAGPFKANVDGVFHMTRAGINTDVRAENVAAIRGDGYVIVTTAEEALKMAPDVPRIENKRGQRLSKETVLASSANLTIDALNIIAWKDYNDFTPNSRAPWVKAFQVGGTICRLGGFLVGATVRVFRYPNATILERSSSGLASLVLGGKVKGSHNNPQFSVGRSMFGPKGSVLRVIALSDGLVLCEPDSELGRLCGEGSQLSNNSREQRQLMAGLGLYEGASSAKALEPAPRKVTSPIHGRTNTSVYPLRTTQSRVQVQGKWLRDYGFVPGARYNVKNHPLMRRRVLLELAADGKYQVTTMSGTTPKLYIPMDAVRQFSDETHIRVFGTVEGLHVTRNLEAGGKGSDTTATKLVTLKRAA